MSESNNTAVVVPTIGESITSASCPGSEGRRVRAGRREPPRGRLGQGFTEVPSPVSGVVTELLAEDGDEGDRHDLQNRHNSRARRGRRPCGKAAAPAGSASNDAAARAATPSSTGPRPGRPHGRRPQTMASILARLQARASVAECWRGTFRRLPKPPPLHPQ